MPSFARFVAAGAAFAAAACVPVASAQPAAWPTKSIRFILPFPPGGGTDTLARIVGQKVSETLGQPLVMDNRPGAGANIGAELAARAAPDGYTIVMGNIAHAVNVSLYRKLGYDLVNDLRAGHPAGFHAEHPGRRAFGPGEGRGRSDRAGQGAPGQVQLCVRRQRNVFPSGGRTVQDHDIDRSRARALQGRRSCRGEPVVGRGGDRVRHGPVGAAASTGRQASRAGSDQCAAFCRSRRPSDDRRVGCTRLRQQHLVRRARTRAHAACTSPDCTRSSSRP
jgi:hypothetical protein